MEMQLDIDEINSLFPNEWVLLGDPVLNEASRAMLRATPIYHSKDKREVCYIGRDKTAPYQKIALYFTGTLHPSRKITGIFNRVKT